MFEKGRHTEEHELGELQHSVEVERRAGAAKEALCASLRSWVSVHCSVYWMTSEGE